MEAAKLHNSATAYRRQRQIEDCLYKNLLHTPYHSISVSDLCRQVGISRKAFYNYYHDKDACLRAIINRKIQNSMLHVSTATSDNASPLEACTALLNFWKDQKPFFDVMVRNQLLHFLVIQNISYVLNEDRTTLELLNTPEVQSDTDILACYISSQITLVLQWYLRGFDTPAEEMAKKYLRITHAPMIQPAAE